MVGFRHRDLGMGVRTEKAERMLGVGCLEEVMMKSSVVIAERLDLSGYEG
jgi:hypothetical protein